MRDRNPWGRRYDRDQDMGREHTGYSNYAGGGDRDMRDRELGNRNDVNDYDDRPRNLGGRQMGGSDLGFGSAEHEGFDREDRGPHYGKGPKGYRRSDERIREDVCESIACQGYIDASDVEVKVEQGIVSLSGTVGTRHEKRALEHLVERVRGVEDVRNELRLQRNESPTSQRTLQHDGSNGRTARS